MDAFEIETDAQSMTSKKSKVAHHKKKKKKSIDNLDCKQILNMLVINHEGTFYYYWFIFISIC